MENRRKQKGTLFLEPSISSGNLSFTEFGFDMITFIMKTDIYKNKLSIFQFNKSLGFISPIHSVTGVTCDVAVTHLSRT